jgi:molybdopterin molybdotransferase
VISLDEAREYVFSHISALQPVAMPVETACGCVAAESVYATEALPRFANSSMDGFALQAADAVDPGAHLRVVDSILAGGGSSARLRPGEAMRIMTGAPLPEGADSVEMLEEVTVSLDGDLVTTRRAVAPGSFVRRPGEDVEIGEQLIAEGDILHPTRLAVLASQGVASIVARPRPRVGVLSTGNELTSGSSPLPPGAIRDVNRPLLLALLPDAGATPLDLGIVRDDLAETRRLLEDALTRCDAVITTGGVSVGDVDYVKLVIADLAGETARSMQVAMRPGKPFAFGVAGDRKVPLFGLPGNPVSTRVSFEIFVRPSLRRLAGHPFPERLGVSGVLDVAMPRTPDGRVHLVHVLATVGDDGRVHVTRAMREGSHLLHAIAPANAIAAVPDGVGLAAGDAVRLMVLHPDELAVPVTTSQ